MVVTLPIYDVSMSRQIANIELTLQPFAGIDRCILMLEGLWDQLEATASTLRTGDEQPSSVAVVKARLRVYKARMRELYIQFRGRMGHRNSNSYRTMATTLAEVSELLDWMEDEPVCEWVGTLYRAQDAVVASLHELRQMRYVIEEQQLIAAPATVIG